MLISSIFNQSDPSQQLQDQNFIDLGNILSIILAEIGYSLTSPHYHRTKSIFCPEPSMQTRQKP